LLEDVGGGAAAPLADGVGFLGAGEEVLMGEAISLLVSLWTGGTKGSGRPTYSELAPLSSITGGEEKSSSTRGCFLLGATLPELVVSPRGEEGDFPAPECAKLL
jgi:hypothetical protein